jgi:sigma-B regulation protein RsbU (phosphoserine phosphatase)
MQMTPGLFVAGDLFDALPLDDGRVAFVLGDVSGHGAGSAMLMATTQSHLHAELRDGQGPAAAVTAVNEYLSARTLGGRFVSLWVGLFARDGTVEYVDAGHGYWMHLPSGEGAHEAEMGIPVGIDGGRRYESRTIRLSPGERVLAFSDGMIEQRRPGGLEFGIGGLRAAVARSSSAEEDVRSAMATLNTHLAPGKLADDATVASIEFTG